MCGSKLWLQRTFFFLENDGEHDDDAIFFSLDLDLYQIHHSSIQQNYYDVAVKISCLEASEEGGKGGKRERGKEFWKSLTCHFVNLERAVDSLPDITPEV